MAISHEDINLLIYKYLEESNFDHTAFIFQKESFIDPNSQSAYNLQHIPSYALVHILQKSLSYMELQKSIFKAKKDKNDPIHADLAEIEEKFGTPLLDVLSDDENYFDTHVNENETESTKAFDLENPISITPYVATILAQHPQAVYSCCWNANGSMMVSAGGKGSAILWSCNDGVPNNKIELPLKIPQDNKDHDISSVDIDKTQSLVVFGSFDTNIYLYNLLTKKSLALNGHDNSVFNAKFNPSGHKIVSVGFDPYVIIWEKDGTLSNKFELHHEPIISVSWKNDYIFATASADKNIGVVNLEDGSKRLISGHENKVKVVSFNSSGILASASEDKTVKIWNNDFVCIHTLVGHEKIISDIQWNPKDNNILATSSLDGTINIWDTKAGKKLVTMSVSSSEIMAIQFSPDGELIASGDERSVSVFDVATGNRVVVFEGNSEVHDLKWDNTGKHISVCFEDSTIAIIHIQKVLDGAARHQ